MPVGDEGWEVGGGVLCPLRAGGVGSGSGRCDGDRTDVWAVCPQSYALPSREETTTPTTSHFGMVNVTCRRP